MHRVAVKTKVTKGRQHASTPSGVRRQPHIGPNAALKWRVQDSSLPVDAVKAFRGSGKKGSVKHLLSDRRRNRQKEDASQR